MLENIPKLLKVDKESQMEPHEFCAKWIKEIRPGEWGYFKACVEELARVTKLAPSTISKWGPDFSKRPDSVLVTLKKEDTLREVNVRLHEIQELLEQEKYK
ncbi:MAG: hypothetical protein WBG70_11520 [Spirulinaceae cyanobacterium]